MAQKKQGSSPLMFKAQITRDQAEQAIKKELTKAFNTMLDEQAFEMVHDFMQARLAELSKGKTAWAKKMRKEIDLSIMDAVEQRAEEIADSIRVDIDY